MTAASDLLHAAARLRIALPDTAEAYSDGNTTDVALVHAGVAGPALRRRAAATRDPKLAGAWLAHLAGIDPQQYTAAVARASGAILAAARTHQVTVHPDLANTVVHDPHTHPALADVAGNESVVWATLHASPFVTDEQSRNAPCKRVGGPPSDQDRALAAQLVAGNPTALDDAAATGNLTIWAWLAGDARTDAAQTAANGPYEQPAKWADPYSRHTLPARAHYAYQRRLAGGDPRGAARIAAGARWHASDERGTALVNAAADGIWDLLQHEPGTPVAAGWWPLLAQRHGAAAALAGPLSELGAAIAELDDHARAELARQLETTFGHPERFRVAAELADGHTASLHDLLDTVHHIDASVA